MPYYRFYFIDPSGHILSCRDFESDSDSLAVEAAEDLRKGEAAELWQEGRMVLTFPAEHWSQHG